MVPAVSLMCVAPWICAQSLQLQANPAGKDGLATITLASPPGAEPVALQWEFSLPVPMVMDSRAAAVGEAARQVQKFVRCEILANRQGKDQTCRCILAGGVKTIPNGAVATLPYNVRNSRPGRYALEMKKALAVNADGKKAVIKDTRAEIVVPK